MKATNLSLLLFLLFFCATLKAQHKFNGNMEILDGKGTPAGWDLTYKNQNKYEVKLDSLIKKQGKYSVSITSNTSATSGAILFPIHETFHGKSLILVGNIKTENVTDGFAGVWLRTEGKDGKVLAFESMQNQGLKGTNDWKEYMVQLLYNEEEVTTIYAGALLVGKGKIWVDSLRLYLDEKPIDDAPLAQTPGYAALKDTVFNKYSGIDSTGLANANISYLTLIGELWGFLKYHHPAIARGDYNWDAQLFRILPAVLKCENNK